MADQGFVLAPGELLQAGGLAVRPCSLATPHHCYAEPAGRSALPGTAPRFQHLAFFTSSPQTGAKATVFAFCWRRTFTAGRQAFVLFPRGI